MVRSFEEKKSGATLWVILGIMSWFIGVASIPSTYLGYSERANIISIAFGFVCMIVAQVSLYAE